MINRVCVMQRIDAIISQERTVLHRLLKGKRVNDVLQIGGSHHDELLRSMTATRQFFLNTTQAPFETAHVAVIHATAESLPIQTDSMDMVLMVHQLELAQHPMDMLEEAYRVLRPNGQLIVIGSNPWSIWNVCHERESFVSVWKIERCMHALQLEIKHQQTLCFWLNSKIMETIGQFIFPSMGSIYLFIAQKNIMGMTPLFVRKQAIKMESRLMTTR